MARKERRKKKKKEEKSGGASWVTTFSDLMSLLLTFFILLFSMSTVSEEKFNAASASIQEAFIGDGAGAGIMDGGMINDDSVTGDGATDAETDNLNMIPQEVTEMYEEAIRLIEAEGIEDQVSVSSDQDGVYLDIQESILFESGEAEIKENGMQTMDSLIGVLRISDNDIVIEGYTDDIPMSSREFESNWELSTGRALSVVHYLTDENEIEPVRLSAKGYGEYSPRVANDSPENRAKNRRVNIVLVYKPVGVAENEE